MGACLLGPAIGAVSIWELEPACLGEPNLHIPTEFNTSKYDYQLNQSPVSKGLIAIIDIIIVHLHHHWEVQWSTSGSIFLPIEHAEATSHLLCSSQCHLSALRAAVLQYLTHQWAYSWETTYSIYKFLQTQKRVWKKWSLFVPFKSQIMH